jgi:hypothetical protein
MYDMHYIFLDFGFRPTDEDVDAILRRLDHDGDGALDLKEVEAAFTVGQYYVEASSAAKSSYAPASSEYIQSPSNQSQSQYYASPAAVSRGGPMTPYERMRE